MEVYSAQKTANPKVTLTVTFLTLVLVMLGCWSLALQKRMLWDRLLGDRVQIDDVLSLRIPDGWKPINGESGQLGFESDAATGLDSKLWISRTSIDRVSTLKQALEYSIHQLIPNHPLVPQTASRILQCRLGDDPAHMTMLKQSLVTPLGQYFILVLYSSGEEHGSTILTLLVGGSERLDEAFNLLRSVAASAVVA